MEAMKTIRHGAVILVGFILMSFTIAHEYYVSVTTIEYVPEQQSVQIISQIFIDDLENVLRQRYDEGIILADKNEPKAIKGYLDRYLTEKLRFEVNGMSMQPKFLGHEYKEDIAYCYLEIEHITDIKSIKVTNRILFDMFDAQQNILRLKINEKNKSFLLIPDDDNCMLNFD